MCVCDDVGFGDLLLFFCNASGLGREEGAAWHQGTDKPSPAGTIVSTFATFFSVRVLYTHQLMLFTFLDSATLNFPLLEKGEQLPDVTDSLFRARIICTKRELWVGVA